MDAPLECGMNEKKKDLKNLSDMTPIKFWKNIGCKVRKTLIQIVESLEIPQEHMIRDGSNLTGSRRGLFLY